MNVKAIGLEQFGGPEVLHIVEVPQPEPGPGQVRIQVAAAGVNPTDATFRSGGRAAQLEGQGWSGPTERGIRLQTISSFAAVTNTALLQQVRDRAEDGTLPAVIAEIVPAENAAYAHRRLANGGLTGRLVLDMTTIR